MSKLFYFKQFSICTHFSSTGPVDRTVSGATTLNHCGLESDGNDGVLCIHQGSRIIGTSPDCLASYSEHSWRGGGSYPSAEKQFVYFRAPADWASYFRDFFNIACSIPV